MAEETITKQDKEISSKEDIKKEELSKALEEAKKKIKAKKAEPSEKSNEIKVEAKKKERIGILNIYTTFNNTLMILTDMTGKTLARFTGGQSTKQSRLKANPTVAMFVSQRIAEEAKDNKITGFYVKIRAQTGENNPGPGAHAAIKSLTRAGFKILSIMDITRNPRGGPKKKGGRRGRRV